LITNLKNQTADLYKTNEHAVLLRINVVFFDNFF
jgi:hypothetical protein